MLLPMRICEDEAVFDWIKQGRANLNELGPKDPDWAGNTIRNLLPDEFEAYAKIFHRMEGNYTNIDNPISDEEQAILEIRDSPALKALVERIRERGDSLRVRWREVADEFGLPFVAGLNDDWFRARLQPGCWPRFIYGPGEGYLEKEEYEEIASLLREEGYSEECFYRLAEIPFVATDQPLLFEGTLAEVTSIPVMESWNSPEYWWSAAHEWCVCSDYDLSFTIFAGPRRVVSKILSSPLIEAIEVSPELRVDYFAPMPGA